MPLKLSIATSRKVGEPNYGSRGATVGLEMEVDSSLVDQPKQLHERIARLFRLAKASVDRELGVPTTRNMQYAERNGTVEQLPVRAATPNQVRAIYAIANRREIDLVAELRGRFGVDRPDDLSLEQASDLIDAIKPAAASAANQG